MKDNLGKNDYEKAVYQGEAYSDVWHVTDFKTAQTEEGYYTTADALYYHCQNSPLGWFRYNEKIGDWEKVSNPAKDFVLEHLNISTYNSPTVSWNGQNIRDFRQSTPYALENKIQGYYQLRNSIYYYCNETLVKNGKFAYHKDWYEYTDNTWKKSYVFLHVYKQENTATYLGEDYTSAQLNWKGLQQAISASRQNQQTREEKEDGRNTYDPDDSDYPTASGSARPETIDSGTENTAAAQDADPTDWDSDWGFTNFTSTALWQSIEAELNQAVSNTRSTGFGSGSRDYDYSDHDYSSDYDSWDSSDTDWDSDW